MTAHQSREYRNNVVSELSRAFPRADPRLFSAILKNPRESLFPEIPVESLYGEERAGGFDGRPAPSVFEVSKILVESGIQKGDQVLLVAPTDPYFLLILSELTLRISIFEENPSIAEELSVAVCDLGLPHIKIARDYSMFEAISRGKKIIHVDFSGKDTSLLEFYRRIPEAMLFCYVFENETTMERTTCF
jgi:hypothetical protein